MSEVDDTSAERSNDTAPSENSIRASRPARKAPKGAQAVPKGSATPKGTVTSRGRKKVRSTHPKVVPEEVAQRFVQVKNKYYFRDGVHAFTDRGNRLTTPSENTEVVRSLVTIAKARGWNEITVTGTERFRKEAWQAAQVAGLAVRGYQPSEFEQAHLVRNLHRQRPESALEASQSAVGGRSEQPSAGERSKADTQKPLGLLTGKLVDHGRAAYKHDLREPISYFVKLETDRGDREIWGVDLERAFRESLTKPQIGEEIGLRAVRKEAVKVKTPTRDADGKEVGLRELATHRNRWIVERRGFFEERAEAARTVRDVNVDPKQAVKKHPELVGTYLQVHAAQLAARSFRDPEDRELFVAKVRSALADSVARGEPLPAVRLRERATERKPKSPEREAVPNR